MKRKEKVAENKEEIYEWKKLKKNVNS